MKELRLVLLCLVILTVVSATPMLATNEPDEGVAAPTPSEEVSCSATKRFQTAAWKSTVICSLFGPAQVQGYRVQCTGATYLDYQIADCCISGDHWSLKGKNWDTNPNTAVTTSPGPANAYGLASRVYNYGGTAWSPGNIDTYLQCTYLHGVDVFPAGAYIALSSDGTCTVTPDTIRSRIDRMP